MKIIVETTKVVAHDEHDDHHLRELVEGGFHGVGNVFDCLEEQMASCVLRAAAAVRGKVEVKMS